MTDSLTTAVRDAVHVVDAASVMRLLPGRPRLLGLGEPTHGGEALLETRNALFRQLVEQEHYRIIALESDCMAGLLVDAYVTSGATPSPGSSTDITLDEVMERGISHEWGAFAGNRELVRWMRAYNDGRPASEQVRFAGFDGPLEITAAASPRQAVTALHAYLARRGCADLLPCTAETLDRLIGADDQWTDPAAMMDPARSVGRTREAERLRLLVDDLVVLLDTQSPHLIAQSSRDDWDRARMYGRTAAGLLRYHFWMADTSPNRMARLLDARTSMMAGNLLAIAEQGPALVSAHNSHLLRQKSSMRMWQGPVQWWSAGAIVDAALGEDYACIATALGTIARHGVPAPPPETIEGLLYAQPAADRCVVDVRRLAGILGETMPAPRTSPWFGYAPLDPAHLSGLDALVFVRDAQPSQD